MGNRPQHPALAIRLLGGFLVSIGEGPIPETTWRRRAAARLIKLLALAPRHRLHRDHIVDVLWPHLDARAGASNLYRALHIARHVLEPGLPSRTASAYLGFHGEVLMLGNAERSAAVWIDVDEFEAAAQLARRNRDPKDYAAALALYAGDLLPDDRYADWIISRREQLRQCYADLLRDAALTHEALGNVQTAIDVLRRLVVAQPTDEEAHVVLMRLLAGAGRRDQALRQFEVLRASLRNDLEIEPRPTTLSLHRELQTGSAPASPPGDPSIGLSAKPVLPATPTGALGQASTALTNLPAALTSFVGRAAERAEVRALLERSRLVTLTGVGGCGKTRLAFDVAASLASSYADGVWLVELVQIVDAAMVPAAVARCLGVTEQPGRNVSETLADTLRHRRLLLVLDNCEHLVDACASLVVTLLTSCPWVRVLATSRERLRCAGETIWQVPPLMAPDPDLGLPGDALARYDAIRLFVARARTVRPTFRLIPRNAPVVAQICHRLDGIPLAIELAVARLQVLSLDEVATLLDDLLGLLSHGYRSAPARHQTVRATLDWSYGLLDPAEQAVLRSVSVFVGGFDRGAAERVTLGSRVLEGRELVDLLSSLVDKSLVLVDRAAPQVRYQLLETVRQYATERLGEAGDEVRVRTNHRDWCLEFAEQEVAALEGPRWAVALERIMIEEANLQAAMATCEQHGEISHALQLAGALWRYWYQRGDVSDGRRWLERLLQDTRSQAVAIPIRVRALLGAGWFAFQQGNLGIATARFTESLELGDSAAAAFAQLGLGNVAEERGDFDSAFSHHRASLALERQLGYPARIARVLDHLAQSACAAGEDAEALRLTDEALELRHSVGDELGSARAYWNRGVALEHLDDLDGAERALDESLRLWRTTGDALGVALATSFLGIVAARRGDVARAAAMFAEDLMIARARGVMWGLIAGFLGASMVLGLRRQPDQAAGFLGCVAAVTDATGIIVKPSDQRIVLQHRQHLCEQLGDAAFEVAFQVGRALPLDEAVELALAVCTLTEPPERTEQRRDAVRGPLTAREREVAELIVRGDTNRQIATSLSLSPRTVDTHVSRILHKYGLASRAHVAAHHMKIL